MKSPMLAKTLEGDKLDKNLHKYKIAQPKYDGVRCNYFYDNGLKAKTRNGNSIRILDNHAEILTPLFEANPGLVLDGELYSHFISFNDIISSVRTLKGTTEHDKHIRFIVYDIMIDKPQLERLEELDMMFGKATTFQNFNLMIGEDYPIVNSYRWEVNTKEDLIMAQGVALDSGYEGLILRNHEGLYENKRSSNLIKVKIFMDDEFEIIETFEGEGKDQGLIMFRCITPDKNEFKCRPSWTDERRKEAYAVKESFISKPLTVKFFGYTPAGKPRFPVGIEIRDYE